MAIERASLIEAVAQNHGHPRDAQVLRYLNDVQRKLQEDLKIENWEGLKVLDVACGNGAPEDPKEQALRRIIVAARGSQGEDAEALHQLGRKLRQPWVCRLLAASGAEVTGVDWKYPRYEQVEGTWQGQSESGWTFIQRDLRQPCALDPKTFRANSYDLVLCKDFLGPDNIAAPEMMTLRDYSRKAYEHLERAISLQLAQVVKKNGVVFWNEKAYRPKGQRLLPMH